MFKLSLAAGCLALGAVALAGPENFAARSFGVRAGVVVIESGRTAGYPANFTPHIWSNLDANQRLKPGGMYLYNPAHESQYTAALRQRWSAIATAVGAPQPPAVGTTISKRDAAYWEVPINSFNDTEVAEYDVLELSAYGNVALNPSEREKLHRFCDKGGVLWIDVASSTSVDIVNNFPVAFDRRSVSSGPGVTADYAHPLLSYPTSISGNDIDLMSTDPSSGIIPADLGPLPIQPIEGSIMSDFGKIRAITSDGFGTTIGVARVGDGFVVVTSKAVARALNHDPNLAGWNSNQGPTSATPLFDRSSDAAAKFALNLIYLASGSPQSGQGARKSNNSPIDVGAPLLKSFDTTTSTLFTPYSPPAGSYVPPAIYKGMVIVVGQDRVYAFDLKPRQDLDGNGNSDDGLPDLQNGENFDMIWASQPLPGPLSAPTCAEVPSSPLRDVVWVTTATGDLVALPIFPGNPLAPVPPAYVVNPPNGPSSASQAQPIAPVFHEGEVYVSDIQDSGGLTQTGRVWVVDASSGTKVQSSGSFVIGGVGTQLIPPISGAPTVGFVPIADNSGGMDRVIYLPTLPNPTFGGPNSNAGVYSFWIGVKGERPSSFAVSGNQLVVATRASGQGLDLFTGAGPYGVKLTMLHPNGDPYTTAEMNATFTGSVSQAGGILNFGLQAGFTNFPPDTGIRVDYTVNWGSGNPSATSQILRGFMIFPDDNNKNRRVLGSMALSPQGTLHAVVANPGGGGGGFFSLREEGRGSFRVINRYEMYGKHSITLNQAGSVDYSPTLLDTDPLQGFAGGGFLSGDFGNLGFSSGPTVHNGVVYCIAKGTKRGVVPCSIVMAFKSEPEVAEVKTGDLGSGFIVVQPDIARSTSKTAPETYSAMQASQFTYEKEAGSDSGTIRFENLSSTSRGPMINSISLSQPIIIRRPGQPDLLLDPPTKGNRFNPLLWWTVAYGETNTGPSAVTGNTLFYAGASALPSILKNPGLFPPVFTGVVTGMKAEISPTDPFLGYDSRRPWQKQLYRLKTSPVFVGNPDFLWPQNAGIQDFEDFRIRLLQTTLGNSNNAFGVVAGDSGVASWSAQGLWGFNRADFLVCDSDRLARIDASGNVLWTSDATFVSGQSQDVGGSANVKPLVRPTRAYANGDRGMIVVDPGANRVIRMDLSGREQRSIDGFKLDPNVPAPDGMSENESTSLREPRDVLYWTTSETGNQVWAHYLVADSGNKRLVEIVDKYVNDPNNGLTAVTYTDPRTGTLERALGILYWHSPAGLSGDRFDYNSLARVFVPDNAGGHYVYACGLGSTLPTRADTGLDVPVATAQDRSIQSGNGGIIVIDGQKSQVINEVTVPAVGPNVFYDETAGTFTMPAIAQHKKKLTNLSSVTMRNVNIGGVPEVAIMFTDATGVYEILRTSSNPDVWTVDWMLPRGAYKVMRRDLADNPTTINPLDFRPTYARRLESGEVILVNSYVGSYRKLLATDPWIAFNGEIIQVDGDFDSTGTDTTGFNLNKRNLGFKSLSIRFTLPPIEGARGIVLPVFADRR